jgi:hypothetical protein
MTAARSAGRRGKEVKLEALTRLLTFTVCAYKLGVPSESLY